MRRALLIAPALASLCAAPQPAAAEKAPTVFVDRLVVGGYSAAKKPFYYLVEFTRRAMDGGKTVERRVRAWSAGPEASRPIVDQSWTAPGDPAQLSDAAHLRGIKPGGDHLEVVIPLDGGASVKLYPEPRRANAMYAVPLPGGYARVAATGATAVFGEEPVRAAAAWFEAAHDGSAGAALPGEWTVAMNGQFDTWIVVHDLAGASFATFTESSGTYARGVKIARQEGTTLVDPDTKTSLPRNVTHTLTWARTKVELTYQAPWSEAAGDGRRPLVNAILYGDGHAAGRSGGEQSICGVAWLLGQAPRKPPPKTSKKRKPK